MQLEICLRQLGDSASEAITVLTALEALARLCWNDDDVRAQVSMLDGQSTICCLPKCMKSLHHLLIHVIIMAIKGMPTQEHSLNSLYGAPCIQLPLRCRG